MALNSLTRDVLFCECKWKDDVNAEKALSDLKEKAGYVKWHNEDRKNIIA